MIRATSANKQRTKTALLLPDGVGARNFLVVNGMSHNRGMRWDLSEAAEWLGFEPADDSGAETI